MGVLSLTLMQGNAYKDITNQFDKANDDGKVFKLVKYQ